MLLRLNIRLLYKGKVTPKSEAETGKTEEKHVAAPAMAPVADNVVIGGKAFVGEVLSVDFSWSDVNKDDNMAENKYQWYRSDNEKRRICKD